MTKKLLAGRIGVGTLTVAFCAALPGCNLGVRASLCTDHPDATGCYATDATPADAPADNQKTGADAPSDTDAP